MVLATAQYFELLYGDWNLASHKYLLEVGPILVVWTPGCSFEIAQSEVGATMLHRARAVLLVAIAWFTWTHRLSAIFAQGVEGSLALFLYTYEAVS